MPETKRPRQGSLQFWPRKRARRNYPSVSTYPKEDKDKPLLFAGYKAGMTHVELHDTRKGTPTQGQKIIRPATVLEVPPMVVIGARGYKNSKAKSEVYAKDLKKDIKKRINPKGGKKLEGDEIRLIVATQPFKTGIGKKKPEIFEVGIGGQNKEEYAKGKLGKEIEIEEIFDEGDYADIIGVTKGKGFQGVVKRYGVKVRGRKDEKKHRHIGTLAGLGRIRFSVPQPGQHGFHKRTEFNKRIIKIGDKPGEINPAGGFTRYGTVRGKFMIVEGSIPGPKKRTIMLRVNMRKKKKFPVQLENIHK